MCQPQENTSLAPAGAWSSTAWAVPEEYCCTPQGASTVSTPSQPSTARAMTPRSLVAPGITVIRPRNSSSLGTLFSRHTPTTW